MPSRGVGEEPSTPPPPKVGHALGNPSLQNGRILNKAVNKSRARFRAHLVRTEVRVSLSR